jgi:hypothetical protein
MVVLTLSELYPPAGADLGTLSDVYPIAAALGTSSGCRVVLGRR